MAFLVESDVFRGPVDLLLFLVRRHEIDVSRVGLADITRRFLEYLEILQEIDIDAVGEFIDAASRLVELKSRAALPVAPAGDDESEEADPRDHLVERLLLYKQFRDAAILLEERAEAWQRRYPRIQNDLPPPETDLSTQPLQPIELWDLVSAFGRVLRDSLATRPERVIYDETPIAVYMRRIHQRIVDEGAVAFSSLFQPGMHKSALVGVFLALLELTRHHNVVAEQTDLYTDIMIVAGEGFSRELQLSQVDNYDPSSAGAAAPADSADSPSGPPDKPR